MKEEPELTPEQQEQLILLDKLIKHYQATGQEEEIRKLLFPELDKLIGDYTPKLSWQLVLILGMAGLGFGMLLGKFL